jgi:hypothetical protein
VLHFTFSSKQHVKNIVRVSRGRESISFCFSIFPINYIYLSILSVLESCRLSWAM